MSGTDRMAYHFLPWVRYGLMAALSGPPALGKQVIPPAIPNHISLPIKLRVKNDEIKVPLSLYGPGDVVGIDRREIVRTEPTHLTTDFPPRFMVFIEFDRPDFPWLFTPASADVDGCLRPWIVLVVVPKDPPTRLSGIGGPALPVLECRVSELPDLTESWSWAHAQFAGSLNGATLASALADRPHQTVSRLLCPRHLKRRQGSTDAGYYACLVPAFEAGRKAGLGEQAMPADEAVLAPAWVRPTVEDPIVRLPVYYHWEFNTSTAAAGDFKSLVKSLKRLNSVPTATPQLMDISHPDPGMPVFQNATLGIESALRGLTTTFPDWSLELKQKFGAEIVKRLQAGLNPVRGQPAPKISPPIYGQWHAGVAGSVTPLEVPATPAWLRDLNLDPRYRVAAALGTQVVQHQQEQLVAAAWAQVEQLEAVNQSLAQKQLGREMTKSVHETRLTPLAEGTLRQITAPVVVLSPAATAPAAPPGSADTPAPNPLTEALLTAAFRRINRPRGQWSDQRTAGSELGDELGMLLQSAEAGVLRAAPPPGESRIAREVSGYPVASATATPTTAVADPATVNSGLAPDIKAMLLDQLNPQVTFKAEARNRIDAPAEMNIWDRQDPLQSLNVVPTFPQPMSQSLRELFPNMLLPGLEHVPPNSITLLEINPLFIEAYMVGLNHELSRELLWREYPTNLRGTYFRQFWDVRGRLGPNATEAEREALRDIPPIDGWKLDLGRNMPQGRGQSGLGLLIQGDFLVRYPTALIYAARATWAKDKDGRDVLVVREDAEPRLPTLRVNPAEGLTLLGFDRPTREELRRPVPPSAGSAGEPGWFFVIQEHPTEPRFGLDDADPPTPAPQPPPEPPPPPATWRYLSWSQVHTTDSGYISVSKPPQTPIRPPVDWGINGANMAYITMRKPFRLQVHASLWAPKAGATP